MNQNPTKIFLLVFEQTPWGGTKMAKKTDFLHFYHILTIFWAL